MGCDIHAHLEYFDTTDSTPWVNCYAHYINFGRNYTLFNALAGVRGMGDCVVDPRGLPTSPTVSSDVFNLFYCKIVDVMPKQRSLFEHNTRYMLREEAETYKSSRSLVEIEVHGEKYMQYPSWHTPSHLCLSEMIAVRRQYLLDVMDMDLVYKGKKRRDAINIIETSNDYDLMKSCFLELECPALNATIASMIAIENSGTYKTRFVFWFDS
jgi:hypothetical protein